MSVQSEITRLSTAVASARTAITNKGGTVTSGGGASQLATDIATIPTGGANPEVCSTVAELESKLSSGNVDKIYKYTGSTTADYVQNDFYEVYETPDVNYLTFEASEGQVTVSPAQYWIESSYGTAEYSTDNGVTWNSLLEYDSITADKIQFRAVSEGATNGDPWQIEGNNVSVYGEILTIIDYQSVIDGTYEIELSDGCFADMFAYQENLLSAENLIMPSLSLPPSCCYDMFYSCFNLVYPPDLPAQEIDFECYCCMFRSCFSLIHAPSIGATTITDVSAMSEMFMFCPSLLEIPELYTLQITDFCYQSMFANCNSLRFSETQTSECPNPYRLPYSGTGIEDGDWNSGMFSGTSGTFTDDPDINTTYYTNATVV